METIFLWNVIEILISFGGDGGEYLIDKETKDMINTVIGKHYNLEAMKNKNCVCVIKMTPSDLTEAHLIKYDHVKLMNMNGLE